MAHRVKGFQRTLVKVRRSEANYSFPLIASSSDLCIPTEFGFGNLYSKWNAVSGSSTIFSTTVLLLESQL